MSDFWSRKLAERQAQQQPAQRPAYHPAYYPQAPQPAPQPQPQPAPASQARPWWDPTPPPQPVPQQPLPEQDPAVQAEITKHLKRAQSAKQTDVCPECGSGNYLAPPPPAQSRKQCRDCGYPIVQSGSGLSGMPTHHDGTVTPARQIHDGTSNYRPQDPFARIGPN